MGSYKWVISSVAIVKNLARTLFRVLRTLYLQLPMNLQATPWKEQVHVISVREEDMRKASRRARAEITIGAQKPHEHKDPTVGV